MINTDNNAEKLVFIGGGVDDLGRVFAYKNKIFRGIAKDKEVFCKNLFDSGLIDELYKENLIVKTQISSENIADYSMIIEHEKLTASEPCNWSFSMVKEAALCILKVNKLCNKYGYQLKDGHLWNVLFKKNNPLFIDIGSIISKDVANKKWTATKEFTVNCIYPLILMNQGEIYLAKKILSGDDLYIRTIPATQIYDSRAIISVIRKFLFLKNPLLYFFSLMFPRKTNNVVFRLFMRKNSLFNKLKFYKKKAEWSKYQDEFLLNLDSNHEEFQRFEELVKVINNLGECKTIVDLAGNSGALSFLISKKCKNISSFINTDYDELALDEAFKVFKEKKIAIENYLLNFMLPSSEKTANNFQSDIVLAMAVTHHLVLTQKFDIDFIFERIQSYGKKYALIEFMPLGLYYGDDNNIPPIPSWYNEEWFLSHFTKYFDVVLSKKLEKNRILFVGKILTKGN